MKDANSKNGTVGERPTGELMGDTKAMPDRGTSTGMNGDTYGADLSQGALNRHGSIKGTSKSDSPGECC